MRQVWGLQTQAGRTPFMKRLHTNRRKAGAIFSVSATKSGGSLVRLSEQIDALYEVTSRLSHWTDDEAVDNALVEECWPCFTRIARNMLARRQGSQMTSPESLVSAMWLKLREMDAYSWKDRRHLMAVVTKLMHRILVDEARKAASAKRGGKIAFTDSLDIESQSATVEDVVFVDDLLTRLSREYPVHAQIMVLRFFFEATQEEIAEQVNLTSRTVRSHMTFAKAWLLANSEVVGQCD